MVMSDLIYFVTPSLLGVITVTFFLLWRAGIVETWHWSAAFGQAGAGFAISTFPIEPKFDAFVSGMIFIGAAWCYSIALRLHFHAHLPKLWHRLFVIGYTALLCLFVFKLEILRYQLFLTDFAFAWMLGAAVLAVAFRARRVADKVLLVSATLIVIDTLARTFFFTFFLDTSDELADFADSSYNLAVHVTTMTIGASLPFAALGAMASAAIERHRASSETDPLTGLLNRRGFDKTTQQALQAGRESAVVVCDIDHFKDINDRFGHSIGDLVLAEIASEMRRALGGRGSIARFGGEEFIAHLPLSTTEEAFSLVEGLRVRLAAMNWRSQGIDRQITASFGIATVRATDTLLRAPIDRADEALYSAKRLGRNRVVVAHPPYQAAAPEMRSIA